MNVVRACRPPRDRRGYTLVLFALLLFGLFALAALVIDLGLARLAQSQMEAAAELAALEGLHGRDAVPDASRRTQAARAVAQLFDDDLDPAGGDPRQFGAGPVLDFSGGTALSPEFSAGQTMSVPANYAYRPAMQANLTNHVAGDLVAGDYAAPVNARSHEANDYQRNDFTPSTSGNAFLARLRRTGETLPDDPDDIGQTGPTLPTLFARGSLASLSAKGRGIPVRATAIAQARRARSIGRADPAATPPLVGAAAIALDRSAWETLFPTGASQEINVGADGVLRRMGAAVGRVTVASGIAGSQMVGELAPLDPPASPTAFVSALLSQTASGAAYLPIIADSSAPLIPNRIIGFGRVTLADNGDPDDDAFLLTREPSAIALENASALHIRPLDTLYIGGASDPELAALQKAHAALSEPLLAPALAR